MKNQKNQRPKHSRKELTGLINCLNYIYIYFLTVCEVNNASFEIYILFVIFSYNSLPYFASIDLAFHSFFTS
jgi:hypothetical protein